jgi:CysZ protein
MFKGDLLSLFKDYDLMPLFNHFKFGMRCYRDAHKFIKKHRLWWYVFIPAVLNILVVLLLAFIGWGYIELLNKWIFELLGLSGTPEGYMKWLLVALQVVFRIVMYILLFLMYYMVYRYIILIILSPMLALLSEKTDKLLTGREYPFVFKNFIIDVLRGIRVATRNTVIEFCFMIVLFFFSYVPVIGYISPVIMFFITCYYYGFSMMDYTNERNRLSVKRSVRFVRRNRGFAMANGMVFYLIFFFVPVIGFMVAPTYAVVAATLGIEELKKIPFVEKPGKLKNPKKWRKQTSQQFHT